MIDTDALSIDIRPQSSVYATYRRMAYKMWYAIGEFVDNSTQNFLDHERVLREFFGEPQKLIVDVIYNQNEDTLTVIDTAHGMEFDELQRAVQLDKPPPNRTGRSEFGMGLKMAACWLGRRWKITTKQLGSTRQYEVTIDVDKLGSDSPSSVEVITIDGKDPADHRTTIHIEGLFRKIRGATLTRVKEHLGSMYRRDIESGRIVIKWDGEPISWDGPKPFREVLGDGQVIEWKRDLDFQIAGLPVKGFACIFIPGSRRLAGFQLFRRDRLVVGGPGEGYRPPEVFGDESGYEYFRLYGELDLDSWPVTQTKDGFDWGGDLEYELIQKLREETRELVRKAQERDLGRSGSKGPTRADAEIAGDVTKGALADPSVSPEIAIIETGPPVPEPPADEQIQKIAAVVERSGEPTYVKVGESGLPTLSVYWADTMHEAEVYADYAAPTDSEIILIVNLNHPFVVNVLQRDPQKLEVWAQLLYVDAIVESALRKRGREVSPATFREYRDRLLRRVRGS